MLLQCFEEVPKRRSSLSVRSLPSQLTTIHSTFRKLCLSIKKVRTFLRPPVDLDLNLVSKLASLFIMEHLSVPPIGNLVPRKLVLAKAKSLT